MDRDRPSANALDGPQRALRALTARAACGRVVLRARTEEFAFREVCRTVAANGYHACAVHVAGDDPTVFEMAASVGTKGPARLGSPAGDPILTPARSRLVEAVDGSASDEPTGATTARFLGRPAGMARFVLSVYSVDEEVFDDDELAQLQELTRDLVAGIEGLGKTSGATAGDDRITLGARTAQPGPTKIEAALREQLEMTRTITDSAQDGIVMIDHQHRIIYWNAAATTIFGWDVDEAMGETVYELLAPRRLRGSIEKALTEFAVEGEGDPIGGVTELLGLHKDGTEFPLELSLASVRLRGRWAAVGIVRDITENKKVLEDLERAKTEAEAAAEAKSQFLANMSHEIRTPLNAVIGMTDLLLDTDLDSQQRDFARIVHRSGESLLSVINDILDFSKMDAGALEFEVIPFSVRTCVEEVGDILAQRAASKGIELVILIGHQVPHRVSGDPGRLRQVLTNLMNNAIKFTERGEVVVRVGLADTSGKEHRLEFSIADTGIGIPEERIDDLFSPFTQVDASTTRQYGGTGLGLSIAKRLVERMGGAITVDSTVGEGTVFSFDAVFLTAPDEEQTAPIRYGTLQGKTALIVDDNRTNRRLLEELLERWGCSTAAAAGGHEALAMLHDCDRVEPFDFAILDFSMPSMNGATLAQIIRTEPSTAKMPLILLTSMPEFGDGERMREIGFNAYLTKPVKQSHLYDAIMSVTTDAADGDGDRRPLVTRHTLNEARRSRMRILVTEDNIVNQKVLSRMLESLGYRCDLADNGQEALDALARCDYDLVFMDCQMPVMDGFEATRSIRRLDGRKAETPVVATTAEALKGDRERCIEAGMNDYISKPIDRDELAAVLERIGGRLSRDHDGEATDDSVADVGSSGADDDDRPAVEAAVDRAPVEIERLQAIARGNRAFEEKILGLYLGESVKRRDAIESALAGGDFDALREEAHAVKGSAGNIGALAVSELGGRLQRAAEARDEDACRRLANRLLDEHESTNDWLRRYIDGLAREGGGTQDG